MQYDISKIINSNNPKAKKWLWECWGDIRIKPSVALIGVRNGFLKKSDILEYLHFVYFDNSSELKDILDKIKKRVNIPYSEFQTTPFERAIKNIFYSDSYFDNILEKFKKLENEEKNKMAKRIIKITEAGKKIGVLNEKNK